MLNAELDRVVHRLMETEETREIATRVIGILCQTTHPTKDEYFTYITAIVKLAMEARELIVKH